jgi:hypothetical protein
MRYLVDSVSRWSGPISRSQMASTFWHWASACTYSPWAVRYPAATSAADAAALAVWSEHCGTAEMSARTCAACGASSCQAGQVTGSPGHPICSASAAISSSLAAMSRHMMRSPDPVWGALVSRTRGCSRTAATVSEASPADARSINPKLSSACRTCHSLGPVTPASGGQAASKSGRSNQQGTGASANVASSRSTQRASGTLRASSRSNDRSQVRPIVARAWSGVTTPSAGGNTVPSRPASSASWYCA